jgi:hypothetical protein
MRHKNWYLRIDAMFGKQRGFWKNNLASPLSINVVPFLPFHPLHFILFHLFQVVPRVQKISRYTRKDNVGKNERRNE